MYDKFKITNNELVTTEDNYFIPTSKIDPNSNLKMEKYVFFQFLLFLNS